VPGELVLGLGLLTVSGIIFYVERRLSDMERRARAFELHPAGTKCPDCGKEVEVWESHRRLFHSKRFASPDDDW